MPLKMVMKWQTLQTRIRLLLERNMSGQTKFCWQHENQIFVWNRVSQLTLYIRVSGMKQFDATHNSLREVPEQFGTLQNLEQLYLRHNQLTAIPVLKDCFSLKVYQFYWLKLKF